MPPINNDAKTGVDSSPAPDANREDSSTSTGANSMLEVVQASFKKHGSDSPSDEEKEESPVQQLNGTEEEKPAVEDKEPEGETDEEGDDATEEVVEEDKQQPTPAQVKADKEANARLDKHPRFQELIKERDTFKTQAEFGNTITSYLKENRIPPETFNQAMQVAKMLAGNDQEGFLKVIDPIVQRVRQNLGEILPDDLKQAVADGEMNEARAKEFARLRSGKQIGEQRTAVTEQQQREQAYHTSMDAWVRDKMKVDPDYKPKTNGDTEGKYEMVEGKFAILCQQSPPKTPAEAVALAEQAYKSVTGIFAKRLTPPVVRRKVLRDGGGSGSAGGKEPTSIADAIKRSFDRHQRS